MRSPSPKHRPALFVSLHRRLHAEQRGFTLVETLIAITLIFGSLVFLAYSAMIGFTYQRLARERQAANGIANRIAEEVRGLAYSKVQSGLLTSGLPADPNLVTSCAGDAVGTFRLTNCSGEKVVSSTGLPTTVPLVPNHGSFGKAQGYPTTFTWRTYVTNNDPTSSPYRVTVMVSCVVSMRRQAQRRSRRKASSSPVWLRQFVHSSIRCTVSTVFLWNGRLAARQYQHQWNCAGNQLPRRQDRDDGCAGKRTTGAGRSGSGFLHEEYGIRHRRRGDEESEGCPLLRLRLTLIQAAPSRRTQLLR